MASIGFFVLPNKSGLNASLKLAADLRDRGHTIHYVGLEDSAEYIASNGFDFVPVFTTHFPKGFHESVASMETPKPWREYSGPQISDHRLSKISGWFEGVE